MTAAAFIAGLFLGAFVGIFAMALCAIAKRSDEGTTSPPATVRPVAHVVEQLDDNEARVRWLFNPVPDGEELQWDHARIGPHALRDAPKVEGWNEEPGA